VRVLRRAGDEPGFAHDQEREHDQADSEGGHKYYAAGQAKGAVEGNLQRTDGKSDCRGKDGDQFGSADGGGCQGPSQVLVGDGLVFPSSLLVGRPDGP
jgi:hypothetical protein